MICGHLARRQIKRDPALGGRRLAMAGLIVGYSLLAVGIVIVGIVVATFAKSLKEGMRQAAQPDAARRERVERRGPRPAPSVPAPPDGSGWTLQLEGVEIPNRPVEGRVHGRPFTSERVRLQEGWLTFFQGQGPLADLEFSVVVFENNPSRLAGRTFTVPGGTGTTPHIWKKWKDPGQIGQQTRTFVNQYALRLEFGQLTDGKLPGKIYACVPDQEKSFIRGTFDLEVRAPTPRPGGTQPRPRPAPGRQGQAPPTQ